MGLTIFSVESRQFAMENPAMTFLLPITILTLVTFAIVRNRKWRLTI